MSVRYLVKLIGISAIVFFFTACSLFGCDSGKKKEDTKKSESKSKSKAQSKKGKESIIDQELKKQYEMYNEIIQYKIEQNKKLTKQSEERYKKLKEESQKPVKTKKDKGSSKKETSGKDDKDSSGSDGEESGKSK